MRTLDGKVVVVVGGTGNVGAHVVASLLEHGAKVAVPSRSEDRILDLRSYLSRRVSERDLMGLSTHVGDIGSADGGAALASRIVEQVGRPTGVLAGLGQFVAAPSILDARAGDLRAVLESYTTAHFRAAQTFLPLLVQWGGTYVFINGPLAFAPWRNSGAGLVSVATAAQHMLFRALAQDVEDGGAEVVELVVYTYVRGRETQPGSSLPAEAVGLYAAHLFGSREEGRHGSSVHLKSAAVLKEAGLAIPAA